MKFLADENFLFDSISLLTTNGYAVRKAAINFQGKPDNIILQEASIADEIILTFDKDFGELIFKALIRNCPGVVLFRLENYLPATPGEMLLLLLKDRQIDLKNNLTVIDENKIRQRPIN